MDYVISVFFAVCASFYVLPNIFLMLSEKNIVKRNYSNECIVTSMGIAMLFPCLVGVLPFMTTRPNEYAVVYVAVIALTCLLGFIDDLLGNSGTKGIKANFKTIGAKRCTTGWIKIILGVITGLIVSVQSHAEMLVWPLYTMLFALLMNFINLVDLRPGRAMKVSMLVGIILLFMSGFGSVWILVPVMITISIFIGGELREKYMMGDAGSNLLGGILGFYAAQELKVFFAAIVFAILLIIHIYAEYRSISLYIETNKFLKFIDCLGRVRNGKRETGAD